MGQLEHGEGLAVEREREGGGGGGGGGVCQSPSGEVSAIMK